MSWLVYFCSEYFFIMTVREVRDSIEKLISENRKEDVLEILNRPETEKSLKEIYEVLLQDNPEEEEIIKIIDRNRESYIPYLVYAEYLVRHNREEESIEYYQSSIKLCPDKEELPEIVKSEIFVHLTCRNIEKAFYLGWTLIEIHPTRMNLRLVGYICDVIDKITDKPKNDQKTGITDKSVKSICDKISDKVRNEAVKTKRIIYENIPPAAERKKETVKGRDIEIVGSVGIGEFLKECNIEIEGDFEVGFIEEYLKYEELISQQKYKEFFQEYHSKILPEKKRTENPVEVDVISYMIEVEDISMLYKISNDLYRNNHYFSSSTLFKVLIDLFSRLHHLRQKFLRVNNSMNSSLFSDIFFLSPNDHTIYREIVKKHNLSVFLVQTGKSKENPLDRIFTEYFLSKISQSHYSIPKVYLK